MRTRFIPGQPHWWQWLTVLSLDAPLVALVWQQMFARILKTGLLWYQPLVLGLGVWIVYAADRWIEGWRLSLETVQTQRHFFPIRWRWPLFAIGLVAIAVELGVALSQMRTLEWMAGLVLILPTLVYLVSHQLVHRNHPGRIPKEFCVAVLFPLGPALAPIVQALQQTADRAPIGRALFSEPFWGFWLVCVLFGLLCLSNLALISAWEAEVDTRHGQTSIALQFTDKLAFIRRVPWFTGMLGVVLGVFLNGPERSALLCIGMSGVLLGALDYLEPRIGREASRALVDLVLLTPVAVIFGGG